MRPQLHVQILTVKTAGLTWALSPSINLNYPTTFLCTNILQWWSLVQTKQALCIYSCHKRIINKGLETARFY